METVGSLVDKLMTVNLKLYHTEDIAHDPLSTLEEVGAAKLKINSLNDQRNALIEEVDELIARSIIEGVPPKVWKQHKDYGKK